MSNSRESFLRGAFAHLNAESLLYCVSRNADEVYSSAASDVDLVVMPSAMGMVEKVLTEKAELHGYKRIARIEFTNLCLVYWSSGADFVRIDLDGELRWFFFEVANASTLLQGASAVHGVNLISPLSELFVMADRLAWQGSLPPRYASRVSQLLLERGAAPDSTDSRILSFLQKGNAKGLRFHLIQRAIFDPRTAIRTAVYFFRDMSRIFRRVCSPPGIFIKVATANNTMNWNQLFRTMTMAFPESKCARVGSSPLPGLLGLFRGGLVIADRGHPITAWICALFSARCRRFRIVDANPASGRDLVIPADTNSEPAFADSLAAALAVGHLEHAPGV